MSKGTDRSAVPSLCQDRLAASVKLAPITSAQVRDVLLKPGRVLEAGFDGVGRDGGPSCATVSLVGAGWRIVRAAT